MSDESHYSPRFVIHPKLYAEFIQILSNALGAAPDIDPMIPAATPDVVPTTIVQKLHEEILALRKDLQGERLSRELGIPFDLARKAHLL